MVEIGEAMQTEVDFRVDEQEFKIALDQAQSDANSFWERETTQQQAVGLMLVHAQELLATTRGNHLVLTVTDGYLRRVN